MPNVDVRKVIQELVVPELKEIKSDVREFRARFEVEIRRLDEKIDSLRNETNIRFNAIENEMKTRFNAIENEMNARFNAMNEKINSLEDKLETGLEFRDRFAALEAKVAALSK